MGKTLKCLHPFPVLIAAYANGKTLRFSFWQDRKKPWDWDRANRMAISQDGEPLFPQSVSIEHEGKLFRPDDIVPIKARAMPAASLAKLMDGFMAGTVSETEMRAAIAPLLKKAA